MNVLLVVNHPRDLPVAPAAATVVTARDYLTDPVYGEARPARVLNLCRADRYQGRGYYVSLLAEARGHRPLPEVKTLSDARNGQLTRLLAGGFAEQLQKSLASRADDSCVVDVYFGRDPTRANDALAQQMFSVLRVPLLRASFLRNGTGWRISGLKILSAADIAPEFRPRAVEAVTDYITRNRSRAREPQLGPPSVAILYNPEEPDPPSNERALQKFRAIADALGLKTELLGRNELGRLTQFDALFIRDTTRLEHYTYRFARRAASEGLVVIDDPDSILKCNNKVYLNELLVRHGIATPKTLIVHGDNVDQIIPTLGLPCILKQPDSAFSRGVIKVGSAAELEASVERMLAKSELVVAQEWLPTAFDWRVGVFDRRPLYVCKYFMAPGHWQVIKREADGKLEGTTQAMAIGEAPEIVVRTAVRAANLIGDGLYGVDLKVANEQCYVIEVNDNPNVDAGNEDGVLQDALYREIMGVFRRRIEERRGAANP